MATFFIAMMNQYPFKKKLKLSETNPKQKPLMYPDQQVQIIQWRNYRTAGPAAAGDLGQKLKNGRPVFIAKIKSSINRAHF